MCFPWFCCFVFPHCSVICFRGRYQHQDSSKNKIINTARTLVLGLLYDTCAFNPLLISSVGYFSSSSQKSKLAFLLNGFWRSGIIQAFLSFGLSFVYLLQCRKDRLGPLLRAAQVGPSTLQNNLFKKNPNYLLVSWSVSDSGWRGARFDCGVLYLASIVFQLSKLFFPPPSFSLSFFFFFFPPWRVFSGKSFLGFHPASVTIHSCTVWFKCFKLPVR